jgi:hypothetical protein
VKKENDKAPWNIVIIVIALGILLWPSGILGISLLERATADCSFSTPEGSEFDQIRDDLDATANDLEHSCTSWRFEGQIIVFIIICVVLFSLAWINSDDKSKSLDNGSRNSQLKSRKSNEYFGAEDGYKSSIIPPKEEKITPYYQTDDIVLSSDDVYFREPPSPPQL